MTDNVQWDEAMVYSSEYVLPRIKQVFRQWGVSKQARVLDAGSGVGFYSKSLYDAGYTDIWSFDNSCDRVDLLKKNCAAVPGRCGLHDANERKLPAGFPASDYDVVMALEVIEHLIDPQLFMDNVSSWLKNGGIAVISTPYHGYLKNVFIALSHKFDWHYEPLERGRHINFFSRATLSLCMRKSRLTPRSFIGAGRVPFFWKSMIIVGVKQ